MRKIIDVSGFGHSGKSAISEFLSDYEDFFSFPINMEFELFRVGGGLIDLYFSNCHNWNLIRSQYAISNFRRLVYRIGIIQSNTRLASYWKSSGHGYEKYFNNKFIELSEEFLSKLVVLEQNTFWPFKKFYLPEHRLIVEKFWWKFFKKGLNQSVYITDRNKFLEECSCYIHKLFDEIDDKESSNIILNNAFEPYKPTICLNMVQNSFSIIVDRDPRDIYASLIADEGSNFIPFYESNKIFNSLKKRIVGFANVDEFILRQRTLRNNVNYESDSRVMRIYFEDFILNHDTIKCEIFKFLGIKAFPERLGFNFNLENSRKNIGIWKKYKELPEIKKISVELEEFCRTD